MARIVAQHKKLTIVALLGCAGLIVVTVWASWGTWFPRATRTPPATTPLDITTTTPETSAPADTPLPPATPTPRVTPIPRVTVLPPSNITPRVTAPPPAAPPLADTPPPPATTTGSALKVCDALQAEIQAKLDANHVTDASLTIMASGDLPGHQVVGSCEGGTKKIVLHRARRVP